jgi:hypothetical protein
VLAVITPCDGIAQMTRSDDPVSMFAAKSRVLEVAVGAALLPADNRRQSDGYL